MRIQRLSCLARIVLNWVTLALDFQCTLPHMVHPNDSEESGWTKYFQSIKWKPLGLPLGEIGASQLLCAC
jgi:hypothetical protein